MIQKNYIVGIYPLKTQMAKHISREPIFKSQKEREKYLISELEYYQVLCKTEYDVARLRILQEQVSLLSLNKS